MARPFLLSIKDDIAAVLKDVATAVYDDWSKFQDLLNTLDKLESLKSSLGQQLLASENLQSYLLHVYFNGKQKPC